MSGYELIDGTVKVDLSECVAGPKLLGWNAAYLGTTADMGSVYDRQAQRGTWQPGRGRALTAFLEHNRLALRNANPHCYSLPYLRSIRNVNRYDLPDWRNPLMMGFSSVFSTQNRIDVVLALIDRGPAPAEMLELVDKLRLIAVVDEVKPVDLRYRHMQTVVFFRDQSTKWSNQHLRKRRQKKTRREH